MTKVTRIIQLISVAACLTVAMPVFAESAPVYDVDSMQPDQFDNSSDRGQYLPPPPPPGQEESGAAYVPGGNAQPTVQVQPSAPNIHLSADQRLQRMEQQLQNLQSGESSAKMQSLQDEVQALRGQVEQLTHQLQQMQNQQKSMYSDLDNRLSQNSPSGMVGKPTVKAAPEPMANDVGATHASDSTIAKAAAGKGSANLATSMADRLSPKPSSAEQPNVAEEQKIYQTAYNLIKAKKYNEAVNALQGMLKKYPSGQFASNAHYWLGELYGLMGKNDKALAEFSVVVESYPNSPRISDAQLKVGLILASQLKWADAKSALKKVVNQYPGTASAKLASEQLKQLKQAGH